LKLVKVGQVILDRSKIPFTTSFILIDTDNKYFSYIQDNSDFRKTYKFLRSSGIVEIYFIEIDAIMDLCKRKEKVENIFDLLIITDINLYIIDDVNYFRNRKIEELGL